MLIRLKAPEGASSMSVQGQTVEVRSGHVLVLAHLVESLKSHGYTEIAGAGGNPVPEDHDAITANLHKPPSSMSVDQVVDEIVAGTRRFLMKQDRPSLERELLRLREYEHGKATGDEAGAGDPDAGKQPAPRAAAPKAEKKAPAAPKAPRKPKAPKPAEMTKAQLFKACEDLDLKPGSRASQGDLAKMVEDELARRASEAGADADAPKAEGAPGAEAETV